MLPKNFPRKKQNSSESSSGEKWKTLDYEMMDTEVLNRMLLDRMKELEREGLVDQHFQQCYSLKEDSGLSFFLELIPVFLTDVCTVVNDMSKTLYGQSVDFDKMYSHYIKLKGSSSCFGACRIRDACSSLSQAIENKSKDGCLQALSGIRGEYEILEDRLNSIIKLEREIVSRATRHL